MACDNLLTYTNSNETFKIHTDTRTFQSGAVIVHKIKPIYLNSKKLTDGQQRYKVTKKELLIIVENLKELRNILSGNKIRIYTLIIKTSHVIILIRIDY